jgi:hypothetical protein
MEDYINEEGRTVCGKCGKVLESGEWPFCPHGHTRSRERQEELERSLKKSSYIQDQIPGGMVLHNYGPEPVTVHSHSEARALAASRGLEYVERFTPAPGTDIDPAGIPNPAGYMDPYTLEAGKALILRGQKAKDSDQEFVDRVYRPLPDRVLTESEAKEAHRAIAEREEVSRGRKR